MKGDFSRNTFRPTKHYSGVRMQQGRVQLDADWNEQIDIQAHLDETTNKDVIGRCGGPLEAGKPVDQTGFAIYLQGGQPSVRHGRYYVDGILCQNEADTSVMGQPDLPGGTLPGSDGVYLFYLDVWQRHVTALEDPALREVALGGPDTATRTRTVWQVKWMEVTGADLNKPCETFGHTWIPTALTSTGTMGARAQPEQVSQDACVVPAGAGYRRLENQLYRVEIHDPGVADGAATFKWSRDNGTLVARLRSADPARKLLIVDSLGKDAYRRFQPNQWIEVNDEKRALRGEAGVLMQVVSVTGNRLEVAAWPSSAPWQAAELTEENLKAIVFSVRGWDTVSSNGVLSVVTDANTGTGIKDWIALESGVQVLFKAGRYRTGDYWIIPARTVTGDVQWPRDGSNAPAFEAPHGIAHHYCALAMFQRQDGNWSLMHDCRRLFPPLTQLKSLLYAGGDGQEAMPGQWLARPLRAGVFNGQVPVAGASVRFSVLTAEGNGVLSASSNGSSPAAVITAVTDANGIAEVYWKPDDKGWNTSSILYSQRVEARLLDQDGTLIHGPILYGASLSVASHVAYSAGCDNLSAADTVQEAIDTLCNQLELSYEGGDGQEVLPGLALDKPLRVGVARHQMPVANQDVRFTATTGQLSLNGTTYLGLEVVAKTGASGADLGIAKVYWRPDSTTTTQQVQARLEINNQPVHLPLVFTARLSLASLVAYTSGCTNLTDADTVQEAIDTLCNQLELSYEGGDGQTAIPGQSLTEPLRVGVARHQLPVGGMTVRFRALQGQISPDNSTGWAQELVVATGTQGSLLGIARVYWRPDGGTNAPTTQVAEAQLEVGGKVLHLPLRFTSHLSRASSIAYRTGACSTLANATDVQQALDTLCSVRSFRYVGGDGQQAPRGQRLSSPLEVAVVSGESPVQGALVRFYIVQGNNADGLLQRVDNPDATGTVLDVPTDSTGIARVYWILGSRGTTPRVEAVLLGSGNQPTAVPPIHFSAGYVEAVSDPVLKITNVAWVSAQTSPVENNGSYYFYYSTFSQGIRITCDGALQELSSLPSAVVSMQVDVPYPFTPQDRSYWQERWGNTTLPSVLGYQTFTFIGQVRTQGDSIYWVPPEVTNRWLEVLVYTASPYGAGVNLRLTVKGGFIRSQDGTRVLDGEVVSRSNQQPFAIGLPNAGDGRRGGDFELWFNMRPIIIGIVGGGTGGITEIPRATLPVTSGPVTAPVAGPTPALVGRSAAAPTPMDKARKPITLTGLKQSWGLVRDVKRGELLVADTLANTVVRFGLETGEEAPKTLGTTSKDLDAPTALVLDPERDELFVANSGDDTVGVFKRDAKGALVPARTLGGKKTGLSGPVGLALDPERKVLFVAGSGRTLFGGAAAASRPVKTSFLAMFDVNASGDVAPQQRWTGEQLGISRPAGLAVDLRRRELFVADLGADAVFVFSLDALAAGREEVKPVRVLQGKKTGLAQPVSLSLDVQNQQLWVANARTGALTVFPSEAQGDVAPERTTEVPGEPRKGLRGVLA